MSQGLAYQGADFFIQNPTSAIITIDGHQHSSSLALQNGGSIYLEELRAAKATAAAFSNSVPGALSSFSNIQALNQGGLVYISAINSVSLSMTDSTVATVSAVNEGGLFYMNPLTITNSVDLSITSS